MFSYQPPISHHLEEGNGMGRHFYRWASPQELRRNASKLMTCGHGGMTATGWSGNFSLPIWTIRTCRRWADGPAFDKSICQIAGLCRY